MRSVEEIEDRIATLVCEVTLGGFSAAQVTPEKTLLSDLGLDSLDYATVMLGCEEWLGVKVDEGSVDWRTVTSVRELALLLHRSQK